MEFLWQNKAGVKNGRAVAPPLLPPLIRPLFFSGVCVKLSSGAVERGFRIFWDFSSPTRFFFLGGRGFDHFWLDQFAPHLPIAFFGTQTPKHPVV